jgi:hypothetical protein
LLVRKLNKQIKDSAAFVPSPVLPPASPPPTYLSHKFDFEEGNDATRANSALTTPRLGFTANLSFKQLPERPALPASIVNLQRVKSDVGAVSRFRKAHSKVKD